LNILSTYESTKKNTINQTRQYKKETIVEKTREQPTVQILCHN